MEEHNKLVAQLKKTIKVHVFMLILSQRKIKDWENCRVNKR